MPKLPKYLNQFGWNPLRWGSRLHAWYDADYLVERDVNNRILSWGTKVGSLPTLAEALTAKQPLHISSKWNNKPAIYFDGTRVLRWATTASVNRPAMIVCVGTGGLTGMMYEYGDSGIGANGAWVLGSNSPAITNLGASSQWSNYNVTYGMPFTSVHPQLFIHRLGTTHATHTFKVNGTTWPLTNSSTFNPGSTAMNGRLNIGARNGGTGLPMVGFYRHVLIVDAQAYTSQDDVNLLSWFRRDLRADHALTVCFLGDSITANHASGNAVRTYVYSSTENPSDNTVFDLSVSGETVVTQNNRWNGGAGVYFSPKGFQPLKVVYLMLGTNDIVSGASSATVLTRLQTLLNDIRSQNSLIEIAVGKLPPSDPAIVDATKRAEVNAGIDTLTGVDVVIDGYNQNYPIGLNDGTGQLHTAVKSDGVHPNPLGRQIMAGFIRTGIQSIGAP